jgi:hypothetical protein
MTPVPPVDHPFAPGSPAPAGPRRGVVVGVAGGVVLAAVVAAVALAGGGDGGGSGDGGSALGEAVGSATTTTAGNRSDVVVTETTAAGAGDPGDAPSGADPASLPAVTIPAESVPPTTVPGSEPGSVPGAGGDLPLFAHVVVDLSPGGYLDFPVHLRADQHLQLLSLGDDGIGTHIEVFAPDGTSEGSWEGGQPGVINGLEWHDDDELPATGTYVIRVVHLGGSDERFVLGFYGDA